MKRHVIQAAEREAPEMLRLLRECQEVLADVSPEKLPIGLLPRVNECLRKISSIASDYAITP